MGWFSRQWDNWLDHFWAPFGKAFAALSAALTALWLLAATRNLLPFAWWVAVGLAAVVLLLILQMVRLTGHFHRFEARTAAEVREVEDRQDSTIQSLRDEIASIRADPVSDAHALQLRSIAETFRSQVQGAIRCTVGHKFDNDSFRGHFEAEMMAVVEWNASLDRWSAVEKALGDRMAKEATDRGIVLPTYAHDLITQQFTMETIRRADAGSLRNDFDFRWMDLTTYGDTPFGIGWGHIPPSFPLIKYENADEHEMADERKAVVEQLFWDAQNWPETMAVAIRDHVSNRWKEQQGPLLDMLDRIIRRAQILRGNGCPECL